MSRKLVLFLAFACALALSACNTMEGLGRDTQAAGNAITGAASKTKHY